MKALTNPIPENKKLWTALARLQQDKHIKGFAEFPIVIGKTRAPACIVLDNYILGYIEWSTTSRLTGNNANSREIKSRNRRFAYYKKMDILCLKIPRTASILEMQIIIRKWLQELEGRN